MQRPESLWDQYQGKAVAEAVRCCGAWPLQEHPCDLEPPFDSYDPRSVSIWDCVWNGWEGPHVSGMINHLLNVQPLHRQGQRVSLRPLPMTSAEHLGALLFHQFPEDESTIPKTDQFLRALPHLHCPVSFELWGAGEFPPAEESQLSGWQPPRTETRYVAHREDIPRLRRLLLSHFPGSAVMEETSPGQDYQQWACSDLENGHALAVTLLLNSGIYFSLRTFTRWDPDPLNAAISAMEDLGPQEWAMVQVLFEQAVKPWEENLRQALVDPYKGGYFLNDASDRLLAEKFSSPLYMAVIRLASNREDVLRHLLGWAEQFATVHQSLEINDFEWDESGMPQWERSRFAWDVYARCSHRPGFLLNSEELAGLVHLPVSSLVSERLQRVEFRTRPAPPVVPQAGSVVLGVNHHQGQQRVARIDPDLRARHTYLAGASGTGKSTLLLNMVVQDIQAGQGVALLDPHGDLVNDVLQRIPTHRIDDVILFDPADTEFPFALNILEAKDENEQERIVHETLMALERYFPAAWGPRLERILHFTLLAVLEVEPNATLADVERMLVDKHYRESVTQRLKTPRYYTYWDQEFERQGIKAVDPVLNKLSVFLTSRTVRNIICQRHSRLDFDQLLNQGKILLANLSTGKLTEKIAGTFGSFLVTKIVNAAFRRADIPQEQRRPFYLYVDEFQAFMNLSVGFERILAEARKYNLVLAGLANQYVGQLSQPVRQAIFGNVGTLITFRVGNEDSATMAREMGDFTPEEILSLNLGEAIVRAGSRRTIFNVQTYPPPDLESANPVPRIRHNNRTQYCRPRKEVEQEFEQADDSQPPPPDPPASPPPPPNQQSNNQTGKQRKKEKRGRRPPRDPADEDFVE